MQVGAILFFYESMPTYLGGKFDDNCKITFLQHVSFLFFYLLLLVVVGERV